MKKIIHTYITFLLLVVCMIAACALNQVNICYAADTTLKKFEYYENSNIPTFDSIISFDDVNHKKTTYKKYIDQSYEYNIKNKEDNVKFFENDIKAYEELLLDCGWELSKDWKDDNKNEHTCTYTNEYGVTLSITADKVPQHIGYSLYLSIKHDISFLAIYNVDGTVAYVDPINANKYLGIEWYRYPVVEMLDTWGVKRIVPRDNIAKYESLGWTDVSTKMEIFNPDGVSKTIIYKYLLNDYKARGWYDYPVTVIYASSGEKKVIPSSELETWINKGWYDNSEPLVKLYSAGGQSFAFAPESQVKSWEDKGWFDGRKTVTIYSPIGGTDTIPLYELQTYQKEGWYDYPVTIVCAPDGRSEVVATADVPAWESVGWSNGIKLVTIYSPTGESNTIPLYQLHDYKNVGWYEYPVTIVCAPDGRSEVVATADVPAWESVGWSNGIKLVTIYSPTGESNTIPLYQLHDYKNVGWYEYPVVILCALDGRTQVVSQENVEAWQNVGWYYEYETIPMYSAFGRMKWVCVKEVSENQKVGWYTTRQKSVDTMKKEIWDYVINDVNERIKTADPGEFPAYDPDYITYDGYNTFYVDLKYVAKNQFGIRVKGHTSSTVEVGSTQYLIVGRKDL